MPQDLPQPGTATEMYLAAILDELRAQRAGARPEQAEGTVELREPQRRPEAPKQRRKG